jgi:uncharacterized protein (TIGR00661 family)
VIGAGGFTLMGETVFLGKPMLSVPMEKQFEQILNARYLEHLHYGACCEDLAADPAAIARFLEHIPDYARALEGYHQDGNAEILAGVDAWLAKHHATAA